MYYLVVLNALIALKVLNELIDGVTSNIPSVKPLQSSVRKAKDQKCTKSCEHDQELRPRTRLQPLGKIAAAGQKNSRRCYVTGDSVLCAVCMQLGLYTGLGAVGAVCSF